MIKIENDTYYISAGETCYIFKIENGVPVHVYFGARVEPEDDLSALGFNGNVKELCVQAIIDGKKKNVDFTATEAWIMTDDAGNSKSLVVELCCEQAKLKATMYYTPHPRGGIFRRVTIKHTDEGELQLELVRQSVGSGGEAYGFLCVGGDGNVAVHDAVACDVLDAITIYDFEEFECPQMLCVYSEVGKGGVSRIFHDILREDEKDSDLSEREVVLFLPKIDVQKIPAAVRSAGELGFGVVALDISKYEKTAVQALCAACKQNGLIAGLRVIGGVPYSMVAAVAEQNDIRYVMIDAPKDGTTDKWRGIFAMRNMLKKMFNGLRVDFGMSASASIDFTEYYPLLYVRNIVSPRPAENFKTRFDLASLGGLGYEFNPIELADEIKRAVRGQILSYQDDARCVLRGDLYGSSDGGCRMVVRKDKSRAYAVCDCNKNMRVKFVGLDEHNLYHVRELNKTFSGAALVHCGIAVGEAGTYVFHILQVADY